MKDLGCSSNAAKVSALFDGDDHALKRDLKLTDQHSSLAMARNTARHTAPGGGLAERARRMSSIARGAGESTRRFIQIRCERGADIARMVGLGDQAAEAISALDEHWNGGGHPPGLRGREIPLLGRVLCLAQTVEVFFTARDREAAYAMAEERDGRWFDPELVRALSFFRQDLEFWDLVAGPDPARKVAGAEPADITVLADGAGLDVIAEGFARVIDAKSPYTARHSEGVAAIAVGIGTRLGFSAGALNDLRRAGLHDIGKLGVSNLILDKPAKLDASEWQAMRLHTEYTLRVLRRVPAFEPLAEVAASHHERMDGRGYHRGLAAGRLPLAARALAVADVCEALTADRPYRAGMPLEQALGIMRADAGAALCPDALVGLEAWLGDGDATWHSRPELRVA